MTKSSFFQQIRAAVRVVIHKTDYSNTVIMLANTYERLGKDPSVSYKKQVFDTLKQLEKAYHLLSLYPVENIPAFYGLSEETRTRLPPAQICQRSTYAFPQCISLIMVRFTDTNMDVSCWGLPYFLW